ncbi:MAG: efflux RND transporter permease subunit, partial [Myxococcota bacterium]
MRFAGAARALMENRHLLFLSLVVILAAGASALGSLPLTEDPRIAMRGPIVLTRLPGASPERVEALVSEKIEEKLEEVAKIKEIDSTSRAGISVVAISLADDVYDTQEVFAEIRDQLAAAAPLLPPEASTPVFDDKRGTNSYSLIAAITLDDDQHLGIASRLAEDLADRLRTVTGTELVRLFGEPEEELVALIDDRELSALGLVASDVATLLRESDSKTPSGRLRGADSDVVMEVEGAFDTVDRVRRVPIRRAADGAVLRVADVARIERRWREPTTEIARVDGTRAVFVAARMGPSERASEWAGRAQRVVEDFEQQLGGAGSPVQLSVVFDQSGYTVERLGSLGSNLLLGGVAVVLVVLLTMGLRAGLVVGATLPLTASLALFGLLLVGGSLQQMSIFGLIMALGLLIDNAIVMVDEVAARLRRGADRRRAVTQAVAHLFLPLFASTLTTVLSFAPIPLLMGNVGDFVGPIGVSVVLALIASFAVSMTVVPALAGLFLRPPEEGSRASGWLDRGLMLPGLTARARRGLEAGMRRPFVAMGVAASIPIVGFAVAPALDSQFFPPVDRNMFDVQVWLPRDASLERTDEVVARVEDVLREQPAVERVSWLVGGSFPSVFYNLLMNKDDAAYYARGVVETGTAAEVKAMLP